jgi:integrase
MLRFFSKIRYQLAAENRAAKYLRYAIGEILLVVIGILIALQINTWNDNRKAIEQEILTAKELYAELNQNLTYTERTLQFWETRLEKTTILSDTIKWPGVNIDAPSFNLLLKYALAFGNYKPVDNKLNKILSTEHFEFKKSPRLFEKMTEYYLNNNSLREYYEYNVDTWKQVTQPYLIKNYAFDHFSESSEPKKPNKFLTEDDYMKLINSREFANVLENIRGDTAPFIQLLKKSIDIINQLKEIIETDYPTVLKMAPTK